MKPIYDFHRLLQSLNRVLPLKKRYFFFFKQIVKIFVRRKTKWSIGIYTGQSLFDFVSMENIRNPVLTAKLDEVMTKADATT